MYLRNERTFDLFLFNGLELDFKLRIPRCFVIMHVKLD